MEEEKRIVTIYLGIDYDEPIEKLKETLKKFDATIKCANEDECQIEIARSQLEDFCDELDLDIDDITEEWDSYVSEEAQESSNDDAKLAAYAGKIDMSIEDFDVLSFIESARQNASDTSIRIKANDKVLELYIDFEDKVYVELWQLDFSDDPESMECNSDMLYSNEFDADDVKAWKETEIALQKFFKHNKAKDTHTHMPHHQHVNGLSLEFADSIEEANENELEELSKRLELACDQKKISNKEKDELVKKIEERKQILSKKTVQDTEYKYDANLAEEIFDQILEGANADVPQHIDYAISSRGGNVKSMRIAPDSIRVEWSIGDFNAENRIYLNNLDKGIWQLAEDIAHAVWKRKSIRDSKDRHEVDVSSAAMKDIAQICDIFDDAGIKYRLTDDKLIVTCGPQQWKTLVARFRILQGD